MHPQVGASLNKAIHVLRETDGKDEKRNAGLRQLGFPGVYESSLKEAWRQFKPVAHLCAAYVTTESYYYEDELSRDFMEYWLAETSGDLPGRGVWHILPGGQIRGAVCDHFPAP
jgi:hypothetical protein